MPGAYIWGWDITAEAWVKCQVDDTGKLIIGSGTIEVEQDTPADLQATVTPASGAEFLNYPRIPTGGTQVTDYGAADGNTVEIYEVTAGTILYLAHWACTINSLQTATARAYFFVTNAANATQYILFDSYLTSEFSLSGVGNPQPPIEIPAGYKIKVYSDTSNMYIHGFIHGYEV